MSTYTKFYNQWKDIPDKTTPITADALNHIETGIRTVSTENNTTIKTFKKSDSDTRTALSNLHYSKPTFNLTTLGGTTSQVVTNQWYATSETINELKTQLVNDDAGNTYNTFTVSTPTNTEVIKPDGIQWTRIIYLDSRHLTYLIISAYKADSTHGVLYVTPATSVPDWQHESYRKRYSSNVDYNWLTNESYGVNTNNKVKLKYDNTEYPMYYSGTQSVVYSYVDSQGETVAYEAQGTTRVYTFTNGSSVLPDGMAFTTPPTQMLIEKYVPVVNDFDSATNMTYSSSKIDNLIYELTGTIGELRDEIELLKYRTGAVLLAEVHVDTDPNNGNVVAQVDINRDTSLLVSTSTDSDHLVYDVTTASDTIAGHSVSVLLTPPPTINDALVIAVTVDGDTQTFDVYSEGTTTQDIYMYNDSYEWNYLE